MNGEEEAGSFLGFPLGALPGACFIAGTLFEQYVWSKTRLSILSDGKYLKDPQDSAKKDLHPLPDCVLVLG
jgi:hypothetical protein